MTLKALLANPVAGKLVRFPLRLLPARTWLPILRGPGRGLWWRAGAGNHGCWIGSYERDKQALLQRVLQPGSVFYDVGANAGFFSLLASAMVGPAGRVVAVEPLPENVALLRDHIARNRLRNVMVVEAAAARAAGTVRFNDGPSRRMGHVTADGARTVRAVSLSELAASGAVPAPHCIKIDVEGGEVDVLAGAAELIEACRPVLLIATHGPHLAAACRDRLTSHGYTVAHLGGSPDELVATPAASVRRKLFLPHAAPWTEPEPRSEARPVTSASAHRRV